MEAIMRAYIVIGALAVLAISAGIYAANTQIEQAPPGYRWAEQRGIHDEDYCLDSGAHKPPPIRSQRCLNPNSRM
jgi:hypothetical protein